MIFKRKIIPYITLEKIECASNKEQNLVRSVLDDFIQILLIIMLVSGSVIGLFSSLSFPVNRKQVFIVLCIVTLLGYFFINKGKKSNTRILVFWLFFLFAVWWAWEELINGGRFLLTIVASAINNYYKQNYVPRFIVKEQSIERDVFILCSIVVSFFSILGCQGCRKRYLKNIFVGGTVIVFVMPYLVGMVQNCTYIFVFIAAFIALFTKVVSSESSVLSQVRRISLLLSCSIILILSCIFPRSMYKQKFQVDKIKANFQQKAEEISKKGILNSLSEYELLPGFEIISGGLSEGKLGACDRIVFDNKVDFEAQTILMPKEAFYLRSYVGESYKNKQWGGLDKEGKEAYDIFCSRYEGFPDISGIRFYMYKAYTGDNTVLSDLDRRYLYIKKIDIDKKYSLIPYDTYNDVELKDSLVTSIGTSGIEKYSINYNTRGSELLNRQSKERDYIEDKDSDPSLVESIEWRHNFESEYEKFIFAAYTRVPENVAMKFRKDPFLEDSKKRARVSEWINKSYYEDYDNKASQVLDRLTFEFKSFVNEKTSYSLSPGRTPRGKDFIDYFLYKSGKGNCTYYATTFTIFLRLCGIPARYVEGYMVPAEQFKYNSTSKLWETRVTDQRAHAWVEVYRYDLGWVPIEVTPTGPGNYTDSENNVTQLTPSPSVKKNTFTPMTTLNPRKTAEVKASQTPLATTSAGNKKNGTGKNLSDKVSKVFNAKFVVLTLLFMLLIAWFASYYLNIIKQRKINNKFEQEEYNDVAIYYYRLTVRIIKQFVKLDKDLDISEQMIEIQGGFPILEKSDIEKFVEIMQKVSFGRGQISKEECTSLIKFYENVDNYLYETSSGIQKLLFRYMKML